MGKKWEDMQVWGKMWLPNFIGGKKDKEIDCFPVQKGRKKDTWGKKGKKGKENWKGMKGFQPEKKKPPKGGKGMP